MSEAETLEKQATDVEVSNKTAEAAVEAAAEQSDAAKEQAGHNSIFEDKKHFPIFPTNLFEFGLKESDIDEVRSDNNKPDVFDVTTAFSDR